MKETHEYLMPDYYTHFHCKMGACRKACCVGWPISISFEDYYRLLGVECNNDLRKRIDCGLHMARHPSREEYAQISPRYDGNCPMRMEDGRCALHAELGEDVLPYVCRLYPRGVRAEGDYECSCANSCEGVLELLISKQEPIRFETHMMTFDLPKSTGRTVFFENVDRAQEIRLWLISIVQNRAQSLPQRLNQLGRVISALESALNAHDAAAVDALLKQKEQCVSDEGWKPERENLIRGLNIAKGMMEKVDEHSDSVRDFGENALRYFGNDDKTLEKYLYARLRFENVFPKWQNWFEHMLVNHMYFSRFPFQDRPVKLTDEFIALCGIYTLLRFLCVGWMAEKDGPENLVDVAAAAFRLIDHTEFDRYAASILKDYGCDREDILLELIRL